MSFLHSYTQKSIISRKISHLHFISLTTKKKLNLHNDIS